MYSLKITGIFVCLLIFTVICDKIADEFKRQCRRVLVVQLRRQIFRQVKQTEEARVNTSADEVRDT